MAKRNGARRTNGLSEETWSGKHREGRTDTEVSAHRHAYCRMKARDLGLRHAWWSW